MRAADFKYDNKRLSDFNFIIGSLDDNSGVQEVNTGSTITFNKVTNSYGKKYFVANTQYDECVSATFDIIKNPDLYTGDDLIITESEYRAIARWLNRKEYLSFNFINYESEDKTVYFYASFNLTKIYYNNCLYAIRCTMTTNSPYGYDKRKLIVNYFEGDDDSFTLYDTSDEIGYIYPDMVIHCLEAGNLVMDNSLTNTHMVIKNVSNGETITIKGDPQIITTSDVTHNIVNDFNYQFTSIGNTYNDRENVITCNLECNVDFLYSPIIKDLY